MTGFEMADSMVEAVTKSVMREIMMFRRGIDLAALESLVSTLPLVIEAAVYAEEGLNLGGDPAPEEPELYREGERVEVFDELRSGWRDAVVRLDQTHGARIVSVKIERIAAPAFVSIEHVRRPGKYYGYAGSGKSMRERS